MSQERQGNSHGIYYIDGDDFAMFFGDWDDGEKERTLTGKIHNDDSFSIDQLEPKKGPCK